MLFVDAFAAFVPKGKINDYDTVSLFLRDLSVFCQDNDLTFIGLAHSPKIKENESYLAPRDCILGSTAWGSFSSTVMFIRQVEPDNPDCQEREFFVLPRNAKGEKYHYMLNEAGVLIETERHRQSPFDKVRDYLFTLAPGSEFTSEDIQAIAGTSRAHAHRISLQLMAAGNLRKVSRGIYQTTDKFSIQAN